MAVRYCIERKIDGNHRYQAALPDELDLRPGMKLRVLRLYDDAWGTAQVLSGGETGEVGKQGAFPIVCRLQHSSSVYSY